MEADTRKFVRAPGLRLACLVALVVAIGCGKEAGEVFDGPPRIEEISSGTFLGIGEREVTLDEGRWEGEHYTPGGASRPTIGLVDHFVVKGDMDGDGTDETAVLLWENSGGSGTRSYLAVMGRNQGRVTNLGTALVGDRVQVITGWVADQQIALDLVRAGPEDAACCPTERAVMGWELTADGLTATASEVIGTFSLSVLEGTEWALSELGRGRAIPDGVSITLTFQGDRVSGGGGCNSYFGSVSSAEPGTLEFSAMGTTQMACPEPAVSLERQYLRSLAGASSYGFDSGWLVLNCDTDEGPVALSFSRPGSEPDPPATKP